MADDKTSFIKENVNKKQGSRTAKRVIRFILSAIVFGIIAVFAAVITKPLADKWFGPEPETTAAETITIERDTEAETTEAETVTEPETTEESGDDAEAESEMDAMRETVTELVDEAMDSYVFSIGNARELSNSISALCGRIDSRIVTISTVTQGKDLFDNETQELGSYTGVLIGRTEKEVIILAPIIPEDEADNIRIKWNTGFDQEVSIHGEDEMTGLCVLSADIEEMDDRTRDSAVPVALGNSYIVDRGNLVVMMGAPVEGIGSTAYSWISYVDHRAKIVDGQVRLMHIKEDIDYDKGTWVFNTDGELVGWMTDKFSDKACIASLSSFKPLIERMSNSDSYSYFGITPAEFSEQMVVEGRPEGIYVLSVANGSPAYTAGIQPGDIICEIDNNEIMSVSAFEKIVEDTEVGTALTIIINRMGRKEYREIEYELTTTER